MVTTFAYYPAWRKSAQDRHLLFRTDNINDVPVHRCWHFVPACVTAWKRIIHEGTFVFTSTLRILSLKRPDVYVIASPPLLLGTAAWFVSKIKDAPFVFHVQDLQPDAAVMSPTDWDSGFGRAIAVFLNGNGIHGRGTRGEAITDKNFLVLFNAGDDPVNFIIPPDEYSEYWEIVVDTVGEQADSHPRSAGADLTVEGKAMLVLRAHTPVRGEVEADHSVAASLAPGSPSAPTPLIPETTEGHVTFPDTPGKA